jgi:hypothetical protein
MEKNGVLGSVPLDKTAEAADGVPCPLCREKCVTDGSIPKCPKHGTEPFERALMDSLKKESSYFG